MKNLTHTFGLLAILALVAGCSSNDKYDLAAQKLQHERMARPTMAKASKEEITLPKGVSVSDEKVIRKGEKLSDGTVAAEDMKAKTFTIETDGK